MTILQQGSHRAPYAPMPTGVPADGTWEWTRVEPEGKPAKYLADIQHGRLVALTINGSTEDKMLWLNQIEDLTFHLICTLNARKVA